MKSRFVVLSAALSGLALACPMAASANVIVLPPYSVSQFYFTEVQGHTAPAQTVTTLGSVSDARTSPPGTIGAGASQVAGSVAGTPAPLVTASTTVALDKNTIPPADASIAPYINANSEYIGELKYYIEVLGPTFAAPLAVTGQGGFTLRATGLGDGFNADLNLTVAELDRYGRESYDLLVDHSFAFGSNTAVQVQSGDVTGNLTTGLAGSIKEQGTYSVFTNTVYLVDMTVDISANVNGLGGVVATSAYLDPIFAIAPGPPNAGAYSLSISNGIGNTPAPSGVPEPASWATMLVGFAIVGARTRRQNVRSALAA